MHIIQDPPRKLAIRAHIHGNNRIHEAVLNDNLHTLSAALSNGLQPDFWVTPELSILHLAAYNGNARIAQEVLEYGADPNLLTPRGQSALHLAAFQGHVDVARILVEYSDLDVKFRGQTALHVAAANGRADVLSTLCEEGNVHAKTESGWTPLMFAVRNGYADCVEILAAFGADVDANGELGDTPLMFAAVSGNAMMASKLLSLGAQVDAVQEKGCTAAIGAAYSGNTEALRVLISHGANLEIMDEQGKTALWYAIQYSKTEAALLLLQHRIRVNTTFTDHQYTALHLAVSRSLLKVVEKLLEKGADIEAQDADGDPPLQWAVEAGKIEIVEVLINAGAEVDGQNLHTGVTVLHSAVKAGHGKIARLLIRHGADESSVDLNLLADELEHFSLEPERDIVDCHDVSQIVENKEMSSEKAESTGDAFPVHCNNEAISDCASPIRESIPHGNPGRTIYRILDIPNQLAHADEIAALQAGIYHTDVFCDGPFCKDVTPKQVVKGVRYKCAICEDTDFCERCTFCFENNHDARHVQVKCLLPTKFRPIKDIDEKSKHYFIKQHGDHSMKPKDVEHVLIANMEQPENDSAFAKFFQHDAPQIFVFSKDPDWQPSRTLETILEYDRESSANGIDFYKIDEGLNIRRKAYPVGQAPEIKDRDDKVLHHQDPELLCDVLFTSKIGLFDYRSLLDFYQIAQTSQLVTRVIELLPGEINDKLDIRLKIVDPTQANFQASSYTWKETSFDRAHFRKWDEKSDKTLKQMVELRHAIYVQEDDGKQSYIVIGVGLRDALLRLRDATNPITIWADQISINQRHLEERKYQVARMKYIYNHASTVIVWTGDEDEDTQAIFEIFEKLSNVSNLLGFFPSPEMVTDDANLDLPAVRASIWKSALEFFSRPVFSRCWVIQEIVVAQAVTVQCGQYKINWEDLIAAASCLCSTEWLDVLDAGGFLPDSVTESYTVVPPVLTQVISIDGLREDFQALRTLSVEALVFLSGTFFATDPRDKIYALLGIQGARIRPEEFSLQPDYGTSVQDVFLDATKAIILQAGSFGICGLNITISTKTTKGLPSWVPCYSVADDHSRCLSRPIPAIPYSASGESDLVAAWPYEDQPSLLVTSSFKAGRIVSVSEHVYSQHADRGSLVNEWTRLASIAPQYITGEPIAEAFIRTCVADCTAHWRQSPLPRSYHILLPLHLLASYWEHANSDPGRKPDDPVYGVVAMMMQDMNDLSDAEGETQVDRQVTSAMTAACLGRKFFVTTGGYFGIGPRDMQTGDEVHILSGTKVPFVLRRVDEEDERVDSGIRNIAKEDDLCLYQMIGETYMHGIMQGEALSHDGFEWTGILIC